MLNSGMIHLICKYKPWLIRIEFNKLSSINLKKLQIQQYRGKGWLQHDFHGIQLFIATMDQNEALGQVVQLYNSAKEKLTNTVQQ